MKRIILALSLLAGLLWSPSLHAAITFVNASGGSATQSVSLEAGAINVTAGNFLVVGVFVHGTGDTITVSDTAGNSFTPAVTLDPIAFGTDTLKIFYCENCLGHATDVVSVSRDTAFEACVGVIQFSGVATSGSADASATNGDAFVTSTTSGTFTTNQAAELSIAIGGYRSISGVKTFTAGSGYTLASSTYQTQADAVIGMEMEYQVFSSIQTGVTASISLDAEGFALGIAVGTFKADAGGGGGAAPHNLSLLGVGN